MTNGFELVQTAVAEFGSIKLIDNRVNARNGIPRIGCCVNDHGFFSSLGGVTLTIEYTDPVLMQVTRPRRFPRNTSSADRDKTNSRGCRRKHPEGVQKLFPDQAGGLVEKNLRPAHERIAQLDPTFCLIVSDCGHHFHGLEPLPLPEEPHFWFEDSEGGEQNLTTAQGALYETSSPRRFNSEGFDPTPHGPSDGATRISVAKKTTASIAGFNPIEPFLTGT